MKKLTANSAISRLVKKNILLKKASGTYLLTKQKKNNMEIPKEYLIDFDNLKVGDTVWL